MRIVKTVRVSTRIYPHFLRQTIPVQSCRRHILTMANSSVDIQDILLRNSTEQHYIEYDGFLSNHVSHGIVALYRLGMSRARIERFINWYVDRLEPVTNDPVDNSPIEELRGKRVAFYRILKHYEDLLNEKYDKDADDIIRNEYPKVSNGLGSSALHGTIHLGYGYSVKNTRMILEGLTYTFHSYRPIETSRTDQDFARLGQGDVVITDILAKLRSNTDLLDQMFEGIKEDRWKPLGVGRFQVAVTYLTADHADLLTDLVLSVKLDPALFREDGTLDHVRCMRQVVYWTVLVFASASPKNNFFLLHGVTCAWAILNIMPLLKKEDGIKVIREFLTVVLAVYVAQGCPELNVPITADELDEAGWSSLVKKATDVDRDEHCYKLFQVCWEMAKDARKFGEDPRIYVQGAEYTIDNELYFFSYDR